MPLQFLLLLTPINSYCLLSVTYPYYSLANQFRQTLNHTCLHSKSLQRMLQHCVANRSSFMRTKRGQVAVLRPRRQVKHILLFCHEHCASENASIICLGLSVCLCLPVLASRCGLPARFICRYTHCVYGLAIALPRFSTCTSWRGNLSRVQIYRTQSSLHIMVHQDQWPSQRDMVARSLGFKTSHSFSIRSTRSSIVPTTLANRNLHHRR